MKSHILLNLAAIIGLLAPVQSFAQCSTAAWSSETGTVQAIGVSTTPVGKKYEGQCGLTVNAATSPGYVTTSAPSGESVVSARFYFLPNEIDISSGDAVIFKARDGSTTQVQLSLRKVGGAVSLVSSYRSGSTLVENSNKIPLLPVWQGVTMSWTAGSGTGSFLLKLDGKKQIEVVNLNNGSELVNEVDLGILNAVSATGNLAFDAIDIRRSGEPALLAVNELFNISTRAEVLNLDNIVIAGFIITGNTDKCVILRGRGQSVGVPVGEPRLEDPQLTLQSGANVIDFSDNWQDHPTAAIVEALGRAPGAASDAALFICLAPGPYTALLRGSPGTGRGIGIVEVIDVDQGTPFLANISTRAKVGNVNKIVIAGFVIEGNQSKTVLIRGRGPSVTVGSTRLADPKLTLKSGSTTLVTNDNWKDAANADDIAATGKAPSNDLESAILTTLTPGAYTVWLQAVGGQLGIGIIEVLDQSGGSIENN